MKKIITILTEIHLTFNCLLNIALSLPAYLPFASNLASIIDNNFEKPKDMLTIPRVSCTNEWNEVYSQQHNYYSTAFSVVDSLSQECGLVMTSSIYDLLSCLSTTASKRNIVPVPRAGKRSTQDGNPLGILPTPRTGRSSASGILPILRTGRSQDALGLLPMPRTGRSSPGMLPLPRAGRRSEGNANGLLPIPRAGKRSRLDEDACDETVPLDECHL